MSSFKQVNIFYDPKQDCAHVFLLLHSIILYFMLHICGWCSLFVNSKVFPYTYIIWQLYARGENVILPHCSRLRIKFNERRKFMMHIKYFFLKCSMRPGSLKKMPSSHTYMTFRVAYEYVYNKTHRATAIERIYKNLILMNLCGASTFLHIHTALSSRPRWISMHRK